LIFSVMTQADLMLELRENRGMSQRQLAMAAKISQVTIARNEAGQNEFQANTAVRVLRCMAAQSAFTASELKQIEETFGISPGVFARAVAPATRQEHIGENQTAEALAAALAGILGPQRATELLRNLLVHEASQFQTSKDTPAVKFSQMEKGTDGKTYQVTKIVPVTPAKATKVSHGRKKAT